MAGLGPQRTLDPGLTFLSASEVRVVIVPIGPVPRSVVEEYTASISKFAHMSLSAARSFYRESEQKTPFANMEWSSAFMHFHFLDVATARRKSRLVDLHRHRQIAVVLGLVYCPVSPSVQQAYEEFNRVVGQMFPEALVQRCFVLEPSEDHIRQSAHALTNLVMFPPGTPAHLEQHLEVWMHDLAALVLTELESWVLSASPGSVRLGQGCYADSPEFTGSSAVMEEVASRLTLSADEVREKKRWGRLLKAKGDLCLLAGSHQDAYEHYRSSAELSKVASDLVWVGAATEGMATAKVMGALGKGAFNFASLAGAAAGAGPEAGEGGRAAARRKSVSERRGATLSPGAAARALWDVLRKSGVEGEVRELMAEARAAYKRKGGCPALVVEQGLKQARFALGLRGAGSAAARKEALEQLGSVLEAAPTLPLLDDRSITMAEIAQVFGSMGNPRRRLLMLWQALEIGRAAPPPLVLSAGQQAGAAGGGTTAPAAAGAAGATNSSSGGVERAELLRLLARAFQAAPDPQDQLHPAEGPLPTPWAQGLGVIAGARVLPPDVLITPADQRPASAPSQSKGQGPGSTPEPHSLHAVHVPVAAAGKAGVSDDTAHQHFCQRAASMAEPVAGHLAGTPATMVTPVNDSSSLAGAPAAAPIGTSLALPSSASSLPPVWDILRCALLEAAGGLSRQAGSPIDGWEVAAALLRDHHNVLPLPYQANLIETLGQAAAAIPPPARLRPGQGPGPLALLRKVLLAAPPLQPARVLVHLPAAAATGAQGGPLGRSPSLGVKGRNQGSNGGAAAGTGSPFIFNPYAVKRAGRVEDGSASGTSDGLGSLPQWVSGDECCVELLLSNPLAVPLRLEQVQLAAHWTPAHPALPPPSSTRQSSTTASGSSAAAAPAAQEPGGGAAGGSHDSGPESSSSSLSRTLSSEPPPAASSAATAASAPAPPLAWQPLAHHVMLPPGGKRVRVVVCGKPLLPGYLTLLGVRFTMSGVTWTQPLLPLNLRALPSAGSSAPSTDGRSLAVTGAGAGAAGGGGSSSASRLHALPPLPLGRGRDAKHAAPPRELLPVVHILPSLPLLRASLDVPGGPPVVVPTEEEVHPAASTSAASSGAQGSLSMSARPSALNVWEGQVTRWALTLTNLSTIPVSSCTITVTNSKGVVVRALPRGHLRASFAGVHLQVDQGPLAAALPLAPGASVSLEAELHVGRAPHDVYKEVLLEVRIAYAAAPARDSEHPPAPGALQPRVSGGGSSSSSSSTHPTPAAQQVAVVGRQMSLPLAFRIHPTLLVTALGFSEYYSPLRDGVRCTTPHLIPAPMPQAHPNPFNSLAMTSSNALTGNSNRSSLISPAFTQGDLKTGSLGSLGGLTGLPDVGLSGVRAHTGRLSALDYMGRGGSASALHPPALLLTPSATVSGAQQLSSRMAGLDLMSSTSGPAPGGGTQGGGGLSRLNLLASQGSAQPAKRAPHTLGGQEGPPDPSLLECDSLDAAIPPGVLARLAEVARQGETEDEPHNMAAPSLGPRTSNLELSTSAPSIGAGGLLSRASLAGAGVSGKAAAAAAAAPWSRLRLVCDCVLSVTVTNTSDRYFRAWLGQQQQQVSEDTADTITGAGPSSSWGGGEPPAAAPSTTASASRTGVKDVLCGEASQAVVQPGGTTRLLCCLQASIPVDKVPEVGDVADGQWWGSEEARTRALRRAGAEAVNTLLAGGGASSRAQVANGNTGTQVQRSDSSKAVSTAGGAVPAAPLSAMPAPLVSEPDRIAAAEALCDSWALCWRMITAGDEEEEEWAGGRSLLSPRVVGLGGRSGVGLPGSTPRAGPHGVIRLAAVDVARNLSITAAAILQPPPVSFTITALAGPPGSASGGKGSSRPHIKNIASRVLAQQGGLQPQSSSLGELWSVQLQAGEVVHVEVGSASQPCCPPLLLRYSLGVERVGPVHSQPPVDYYYPPHHDAGATGGRNGQLVDSGVVVNGAVRGVTVGLMPGSSTRQHLTLLCVRPGLYQLYVTEVAGLLAGGTGGDACPEGDQAELQPGGPSGVPPTLHLPPQLRTSSRQGDAAHEVHSSRGGREPPAGGAEAETAGGGPGGAPLTPPLTCRPDPSEQLATLLRQGLPAEQQLNLQPVYYSTDKLNIVCW